uniref:Filamentous hemagglutinin family N-terminal domain-containing protein n=1 Tax=Candidatus Kentrum sp. DK TaxID=2126562 RepID=A0A450TE35_9GAMM|nr:MAG: filamentous hemagglutinin family N-terminal domain-containing protein [Candidatus Kentron sp. DK]
MTKRNSNIPNRPDGRPRNGASRPRPARHPLSRAIAGALLPASLILGPVPVLAGPEGEQVIAGQVDVSRPDARTTVIDQTSHRAIVGWNRFDLAKDELAKFNQPSASSVILNRIGGQDPSRIFGTIDANGQVFLVNPRGIFFSPTAQVSAASFLASTLDIADEDFMAGNYTFAAPDGVDPGAIINYGLMEAATGGSVTLMGGAVRNEGIIIANQGYVTLAAGRKATLDFDGDGLLRFAVEGDVTAVPVTNGMENEEGETVEESTDAVHNKGIIQADGGQVLLTGRAAREVFTNVVNNEGLIRARRIENAGGVIRLAGGDGVTRNSGALDATGENGAGGRVEVSGEKITLADGASLDASGPTGGGTVRVGGGIRGEKLAADIPNALETEVAEDVTITADATQAGDGGQVVVWADEKVTVEGELSARGGPEGGDGGYVEVSAKDMWRFANWAANVDVGALAGRAGTFLLDPDNITILPGASGGSGPNNTLYAEDISDFLGTTGNGSGASMDVSTLSGSGSDEGNIVFDVGSGPINITWNDDSSHLIFTASNDLDMGSGAYGTNSITIDGAGNFTGDFGQDNNGGALTLKNVTITSTSTSFTGGAGDDTFTIEAALTGNLTGGDGADTFHIGKALTGNVLGGSGADVVAFIAADGQIAGALDFGTDGGKLDYSALAAAQPVTLETFTATSNGTGFDVAAGGASSITGAVSNLTELAGSTNTDTLTGVSAAGTFTMDGATGIYTSIDSGGTGGTYTLTITDIENLVGGSGDDVFIIDNAYAGNLTGGTGNDTFTINAKLTGSIAGGADTDTLTGLSTTNTFIVTTNGTGTVAEAVTNGFTGVENLTGGAGDDRFTIKASHTGDLTGAGGDDAFAINAQLDGSVAGGAGTDTLTGLSTTNTFVVTANGTGTAAEAITGSFTDIENLIGGAGDDSFTIGAYHEGTLTGGTGNNRFDIGAQLAGNIIGEGEDTVNFTAGGGVVNAISFSGSSGKLDYSSLGAQMVTLTDTAGIGFKATTSFALGGITGLTELVGSASGVDTLAGLATGGAFTINGGVTDASTGSYVSTNTLTITDMDNLTGGAGADIFTIDSAHTGTLTGEGGDDTFDIRKLLTGNIAGGAGEDTVTLLTGGSVAGNVGFGVDGGTLDYSALGAATVALTALGSSKGFDATLSSSAHVTGNVTDMTGLLGSASGMDTLVGLAATGGTFTIDDNVGSSYVSGAGTLSIANMENLTGGSQIDQGCSIL